MTTESSSEKDTPFSSQSYATRSLRVTVYGSSSGKTPQRYLDAAKNVGYLLAKRGHICVNGAGQFGCMAAMNEGVELGNGSVVGVIHEMFLVDNGYWETSSSSTTTTMEKNNNNNKKKKKKTVIMRDGGAHSVFANATTRHKHDQQVTTLTNPPGGSEQQRPIREILVAGGDDLQERKKLLVRGTQALIVLPGGPGTWDELWEMACARHLNLNQLPIVCVNVDGFYEPFRQMLEQAWQDELIKLPPAQIVHFAPTAEDAVKWIEQETERLAEKSGGYDIHPENSSRSTSNNSSSTSPSSSPRRETSSTTKDKNTNNNNSNNKKTLLSRSSFFSASPYQQQPQQQSSSSSHQGIGRRLSSFFSFASSTAVSDDDDDNGGDDEYHYSSRRTTSGFLLVVATSTFLTGLTVGGLATYTYMRRTRTASR